MNVQNFISVARSLVIKSYGVRCMSNATTVNHRVNVRFDDNVGIVNLGEGEKRFSYEFMKSYHTALDQIESNEDCAALVCTAEGKFFSNGLDLNYMLNNQGDNLQKYIQAAKKLYDRILTFPMPTVAAINGHAFAGGGFLALAHDIRLMRNDKGWICWNEALIDLRFPQYLLALLSAKLPVGQVRNQAIVLGKRFTAKEAKDYGIVEIVSDPQQLVTDAVKVAKSIVEKNKYNRDTLQFIKQDLYRDVLNTLIPRFVY